LHEEPLSDFLKESILMSNRKFKILNSLNKLATMRAERRRFLGQAGAMGLGTIGLFSAGNLLPATARAQAGVGGAATDAAVLNFALNLEYLEAEFYVRAVTGNGLPASLTTGKGSLGGVTGGRAVPFVTPTIRRFATEIAADERAHVAFLRTALGDAAVARPALDIQSSFTAAARAAGLIQPGDIFDPYADENNFLLAAYLFEDVGVTAYKGASPLITNKAFLEAAAGILAVEAYHASNIRTVLYERGIETPSLGLIEASLAISNARDSLDGPTDLDQGVVQVDDQGNIVTAADGTPVANIVPTNPNGVAFSRTAGQVLNIVYLTPRAAISGGFFPNGANGTIKTSDNNAPGVPAPAGGPPS
jgi:hypothetical protein